jgi:hypothetical protein
LGIFLIFGWFNDAHSNAIKKKNIFQIFFDVIEFITIKDKKIKTRNVKLLNAEKKSQKSCWVSGLVKMWFFTFTLNLKVLRIKDLRQSSNFYLPKIIFNISSQSNNKINTTTSTITGRF